MCQTFYHGQNNCKVIRDYMSFVGWKCVFDRTVTRRKTISNKNIFWEIGNVDYLGLYLLLETFL